MLSTSRPTVIGLLLAGAVGWMWWSRGAELTSVLTTAEQQLARNDYEAAVRTLDDAPEGIRSDPQVQVLRARAYARARETSGNRAAAAVAADPAALHGFRILIYPLAGNRAEEARAQALAHKLVELVPADVEVRPYTRALLDEIGPPLSDELRFDTAMMLDERAARALQAILRTATLGDFKLRHGSDRGAGTLYILFAGAATQQTSN